jgi:drug/metabolite transporter, DME family
MHRQTRRACRRQDRWRMGPQVTTVIAPGRRDATLLVALAASMWGLDGLLRKPLATQLDAGTVVLWEHVIVLLCSPRGCLRRCARSVGADGMTELRSPPSVSVHRRWPPPCSPRRSRCPPALNDFVTPVVLQKLQPVFAIGLAVILLRERPRPGFAMFLVPALAGAWLLTFADPTDVRVSELQPALLAVGAAGLWAAGTVLGRMVSGAVGPGDVTTLRFMFGLAGAIAVVYVTQAPVAPGWHNIPGLALLALIPGLLALVIYYRALRRTPATRATIAELAFPATAAVVGAIFLDSHLTMSQWLGLVMVALAVASLGWHEAHRPVSVVPDPVLVSIT